MTERKQEYTAADVTEGMIWAHNQSFIRAIEQGRNHLTPHDCIAAAVSASPLWEDYKRLRAENEALRRERDELVKGYAADRERFAAQEERHRVKITGQAERIRELVEGLEAIRTAAQIAPAIDPDNYDIDQVTELDSAMGKIYNIAKNSLAKYGRAGE